MKDIFNSNLDPAKQALIVCNYYTNSVKAIINVKEIAEHFHKQKPILKCKENHKIRKYFPIGYSKIEQSTNHCKVQYLSSTEDWLFSLFQVLFQLLMLIR